MRPKKKILLIDHNESRRSLMRFVLETHGSRILSADNADLARAEFANMPDLVLIFSGFPSVQDLLTALHQENSMVPQIVIATRKGADGIVADAVLHEPTTAELLDSIRLAAARKRGPRKTVQSVSRMMLLSERRTA